VPEGILRGGYEALERGDAAPLLDLLADDLEWTEPELPGYPLAGVHRGREGFAVGVLTPLAELLDGLTFSVEDVVVGEGQEVVTGVMRGTPVGASGEWEMPFAHVWLVDGGRAVSGSAYFDRSRLTLAAGRRQLADVADELLDQAAEIRLQWSRLGDALRAAGVDSADEDVEVVPEEPALGGAGVASARLAAVDMAQDGSTREEVDAYLRDELEVEAAEADAILAEVFDPAGDVALGPGAAGAIDEASRLARLFARNRG
jgi:ketosteroid isomerase-like protein